MASTVYRMMKATKAHITKGYGPVINFWLKENINIEFKETPTLKSTLRSKKKTTKQTVQSQQKPL